MVAEECDPEMNSGQAATLKQVQGRLLKCRHERGTVKRAWQGC